MFSGVGLQRQLEVLWHAGIPEGRAPGFKKFIEELGSEGSVPQDREADTSLPLSSSIQSTMWPPRFAGVRLPTFAEVTDPKEFFMRYKTAVESAEGGDRMKVKALPMALEGIAGTWYSKMAPGSIRSWIQLKRALSAHFRGNHAKPVRCADLAAYVQKERVTSI